MQFSALRYHYYCEIERLSIYLLLLYLVASCILYKNKRISIFVYILQQVAKLKDSYFHCFHFFLSFITDKITVLLNINTNLRCRRTNTTNGGHFSRSHSPLNNNNSTVFKLFTIAPSCVKWKITFFFFTFRWIRTAVCARTQPSWR